MKHAELVIIVLNLIAQHVNILYFFIIINVLKIVVKKNMEILMTNITLIVMIVINLIVKIVINMIHIVYHAMMENIYKIGLV